METFTLEAQERSVQGKKVKQLRNQGLVPGIVYGKSITPQNVTVDERSFVKLFRSAGESSLVDLVVGGKEPVKVLISDVQRDPIRDTVNHIDFRAVNMNETIETDIALKFIGESPAVKVLGAIFVRSMDHVTVRCLPKDLVHEIIVDISSLKNIDDQITVGNLNVPAGMAILDENSEIVAVAQAPITEEELAALEAEGSSDVSSVKVGTEEKKAERAAAKEGKE